MGIRVDEKVYEAFKPVAKGVFGSVCRPIEAFMASILATQETEVNFGNTIEIQEIKIERNIRARRALAVDEPNRCGVAFCKKVAVSSGVYVPRNEEYMLCRMHLDFAKDNPREWKVKRETL